MEMSGSGSRGRLEIRDVRSVESEPQEERLFPRSLDEGRRSLRQNVGGVILRAVSVPADDRSVLDQLVVEVGEVDPEGRPVVPARRHVQPTAEWVAVEILSEQPGVVPGPLERNCDRGRLVQFLAAVVVFYPQPVRIATRENGSSRWTTERKVFEGQVEADPIVPSIREVKP